MAQAERQARVRPGLGLRAVRRRTGPPARSAHFYCERALPGQKPCPAGSSEPPAGPLGGRRQSCHRGPGPATGTPSVDVRLRAAGGWRTCQRGRADRRRASGRGASRGPRGRASLSINALWPSRIISAKAPAAPCTHPARSSPSGRSSRAGRIIRRGSLTARESRRRPRPSISRPHQAWLKTIPAPGAAVPPRPRGFSPKGSQQEGRHASRTPAPGPADVGRSRREERPMRLRGLTLRGGPQGHRSGVDRPGRPRGRGRPTRRGFSQA
jgi:hypothetical protein